MLALTLVDWPYGLGMVPWDAVALTAGDYDDNCRTIRAISTTGAMTLASYCHWSQLGDLSWAMAQNGFKNIMPHYWYKQGLNVLAGPGYANAVECMLLGTASSTTIPQTYFSKNPLERHNFVAAKALQVKTKDSDGNVINCTEKPPEPVRGIIRNYCHPGSTVLCLCAGAGGELRACIAEGLDCVGVEKDPVQFKHLVSLFTTWDTARGLEIERKAKLAARETRKEEKANQAEEEDVVEMCGSCGNAMEDDKVWDCNKCKQTCCLTKCFKKDCDTCAKCLYNAAHKKPEPAVDEVISPKVAAGATAPPAQKSGSSAAPAAEAPAETAAEDDIAKDPSQMD